MNNIIDWFARNRIAADLLMLMILVTGTMSTMNMRSEIIPEISLDQISISVAYPGASPETIEKVVINPVEAAIYDIDGIKSVSSQAVEHGGLVFAEVGYGHDPKFLLNEIKARVDGISTFPQEVQKPVVQELSVRNLVAHIVISGNADESSLKALATQIKDDLIVSKAATQVEISGTRESQVSIEVSEGTLQRYNMSFAEVSQAVKQNTIDAPGGMIKTAQGEVALQVRGQVFTTEQLEDITIRAMPDGASIKLGDIATINDGYKEGSRTHYNGEPAVVLAVFRAGNQSIVDISKALRAYVEHPGVYVPDGVKLNIWQDTTYYYNSRMAFMINDAQQGGILVFLILLFFLRSEMAFWISMSVPVSFCGSTLVLSALGMSFNMISMFAFILVMGIVVDEAIVIGENVFMHRRQGKSPLDAAILGTQELFWPMTFSVMTTCCAFLPLIGLPGPEGKLMSVIPVVIISTLVVSVLEASLMLPAHLAHAKDSLQDNIPVLGTVQRVLSQSIDHFLETRYRPALEVCLQWRYTVVVAFICLLFSAIGLVAFGYVKVVMFSAMEGDSASASVRFSENASRATVDAAIRKIELAATDMKDHYVDTNGAPRILSVLTGYGSDNSGRVVMEFQAAEVRQFSGEQVIDEWRKKVGDIPDVVQLDFLSTLTPGGTVVDIELTSNSADDLRAACAALKARLAQFEGLFDIKDSLQSAKQELVIQLKPAARNMGITLDQVAYQVRQAYHGVDVQRFSRPEGDVSVVLRYPDGERSSLWNLENMNLRMSNGRAVPLSAVADIGYGEASAEIKHHQRHRTVRVYASVDDAITSPGKVMAVLQPEYLDKLSVDYPGMRWSVAGAQKDREDFTDYLKKALFISLLGMYMIMAFQFKSYLQPFMVMIVIPFGMIGSLLGHLLVGLDITLWSLVGMVAVSGIVVNDNLVLIDYINDCHRGGMDLGTAIRTAGVRRFRAVFLVSSTTLLGLLPIISEKSLQAQFLIPMAVALGFGTMFSSSISLILVPSLYHILEDMKAYFAEFFALFSLRRDASAPATAAVASMVERGYADEPDPAAKQQWHVGLDEAYDIGYQAAIDRKPKKSPFDLEVLVASWEAGWDDGREELRLRESGASEQ